MRLLLRFILIPIWIIVTACWLVAATVSKIYGLTHGFLWAILLVPIILAGALQMWQNTIIFIAVGVFSYLVLFGLTGVEILLESFKNAIAIVIFSKM